MGFEGWEEELQDAPVSRSIGMMLPISRGAEAPS